MNQIVDSLSTPLGLSTAIGLVASSFFSWGNLAVQRMGTMYLIRSDNSRRLRISSTQALALWDANYDTGIAHFAPIGALSMLSLGASGYLSTPGSLSRILLLSAFGAYAVVIPFTFIFLMPINNTLKSISRQVQSRAASSDVVPTLNAKEEKDVGELITRWSIRNRIRFTIGLIGWAATALSLLVRPSQ